MQPAYVYKPVRFFLITMLVTWALWFISAYFSYLPGMGGYQMLFLFLGLFVPGATALILIYGSRNTELRNDFWDRLRPSKIKPAFLPALFLLPPTIVLGAIILSLAFGFSADQFKLSSEYKVLADQGVISLLILSLSPILEELGFRGYGVDSLRSKLNIWNTSLVFGLLWGMWYFPLVLYQWLLSPSPVGDEHGLCHQFLLQHSWRIALDKLALFQE